MAVQRNILTGNEYTLEDAVVAIPREQYDHLVRCEGMLLSILKAHSYNREAVVASVAAALDAIRVSQQAAEEAPANE